jgi:hypothetical protein
MKAKFRRQFDPLYKGTSVDKKPGKSLTRPDMSMSIPELLLNHSRGLGLGDHTNNGEYFDVEIPRFDDITDEIAYKQELRQRLQDLDDKYKSEKLNYEKSKDKSEEESKNTSKTENKEES